MSDELMQRIIGVIAATQRIPVDSIKPESTFDELKIDSLDGINILFALENEFNINIPNEAATGLKTIQDMAEGVAKLIDEQSSGAGAEAPK